MSQPLLWTLNPDGSARQPLLLCAMQLCPLVALLRGVSDHAWEQGGRGALQNPFGFQAAG